MLAERGWTAEQAARLLRCARIAVTDEQLEAWLRPGGDAYQQSQGRAVLTALLQRVASTAGLRASVLRGARVRHLGEHDPPGAAVGAGCAARYVGFPVVISPAAGSLGRRLGGSSSLHNVDVFGMVYAADVLLPLSWGVEEGFDAACNVRLFSGIGVYPFWKPRPGLHVDVRHLSTVNPTKECDAVEAGDVGRGARRRRAPRICQRSGGGWRGLKLTVSGGLVARRELGAVLGRGGLEVVESLAHLSTSLIEAIEHRCAVRRPVLSLL